MSAQDNETVTISDEACNCIEAIDLGSPKAEQYEEIRSCISAAIFSYQLKEGLEKISDKTEDTTNTTPDILKGLSTDSTEQVNIEIVTDKNYKQIEDYTLRNCKYMQRIMNSNNEQRETSVSRKKKALLYYEKGKQYYSEEKYGNAIVEFSKAVKKDKKFAFAWDMLGISYRRNGNYEQAIDSYNESLKIDPLGKMPLMNIPIAYELLNDYDNAIVSYNNLIAAYPEDGEGYYGLGRMYHYKGDYKNAIDNTMIAYKLYNEANSPYARDAEKNLIQFYTELEEKGNVELFSKMALKHNIKISE